jgi:hypothetical protein
MLPAVPELPDIELYVEAEARAVQAEGLLADVPGTLCPAAGST